MVLFAMCFSREGFSGVLYASLSVQSTCKLVLNYGYNG